MATSQMSVWLMLDKIFQANCYWQLILRENLFEWNCPRQNMQTQKVRGFDNLALLSLTVMGVFRVSKNFLFFLVPLKVCLYVCVYADWSHWCVTFVASQEASQGEDSLDTRRRLSWPKSLNTIFWPQTNNKYHSGKVQVWPTHSSSRISPRYFTYKSI